jgi:MFS superfamily sulfate permease-like transporter
MQKLLPLREFSSAFADLGTFLPLALGLIVVAGVDPVGLLYGFGLFAIATGVIYRRPIPVQPMKAVAAMGISGLAGPDVLMATGILLGVTLVILSYTNVIGWLKGLFPNTVLRGMRLALAISLVITVFDYAEFHLLPVVLLLGGLIAMQFSPMKWLSCLVILFIGLFWMGEFDLSSEFVFQYALPEYRAPSFKSLQDAAFNTYLPQLALTLTNALILTSVIAQEYFPERSSEMSEKRFALSSGLANLLLAPFGAIPMCHGAGGLSAHYGLGSRSGWSVAIFGALCLVIAFLFGSQAGSVLGMVPGEVVAALILYAAWVLADPLKLAKVRPSCLIIIGTMVPLALFGDLFLALLAGIVTEYCRSKFFEWSKSRA